MAKAKKSRKERRQEVEDRRNISGGAGDLVGVGPAVRTRLTWAGSMEDAEFKSYQYGTEPVIADGNYCAVRDRPVITAERASLGDLQWGDWVIGWQVARDVQGRIRTDGTAEQNVVLEPVIHHGWKRADRLSPLYRTKALSYSMLLAGGRLADLAEQAQTFGLRSTFGSYKVDGGSIGIGAPVTSAAQAANVVRAAMGMIGGSSSLMGGTVWLVAVCGVSLNQIEGFARWDGRKLPREGALGVLQAGLDLLALGFRFVGDQAA